ncbi:MAG TPA: choice-of-anchor D domain-containing protein [Candidatus Kapabacteria bacterium]|nr:choice-of-anchor D domain-containing protein [Candidatus Kapabacteria bacterium]
MSGVLALLAIVVCAAFSAPQAFAQTPRITHEVIKDTKPRNSQGRDLWFSMAKNYEADAGKWYELYVASPAKTTVHVAIGKATDQKFAINAMEVLVFRVPLAWEMTQSNVIEDKAIHVWSEDADLTAYLMSRNPATSDGMYIIPSIGWGTEYVVASFASYAYYAQYDLPSEFVLVANQDNTVCTITPTVDIRQGLSRTEVAYPKGKPFNVTLMKGQAVQFMCTYANGDMENFNLSGTTITSNKPVGVVAGVQCTNIPAENTACDHICDMLPPTRTWATTYYTGPYAKRVGGDGFLVVAKEDGTTVWRTSMTGTRVHCVLNKNDHYMVHDVSDASKWHSDKPFMLVQYCNSTDYPTPGANAQIGDPNMTIVNPVEQFEKFVLFQTPKISPGTGPFRNYVNVIVHKDAVNSTKFDGKNITGTFNALPIGGTEYMVYRASDILPGSHTIESDSGVGVYIYGYGWYESYAWTGAFGTKTFNSPDSIAPEVETPTECFTATVNFNDKHVDASKLAAVDLDTLYNFEYEIDPNWQAGIGIEQSFYKIKVIDPKKEAYVRVVIFDAAGNTSTVISRYEPQIASIDPPLTDFGTVNGTRATKTVRITNEGKTDFNITTLKLQLNNKGFRLENPDLSPLAPGESRDITVSFLAVVPETVGDTILFGDDCVLQQAVVIGNGGAPDYSVFGVDICPVVVGARASSDLGRPIVSTDKGVYLKNSDGGAIWLDDITISNSTDFEFDRADPMNPTFPLLIPAGGEIEVKVTYKPTSTVSASTDVTFVVRDMPDKIAKVTGCAIEPGAEIVFNISKPFDCVAPGTVEPYEFTIKSTGTATTRIKEVRKVGPDAARFGDVNVFDGSGNLITAWPKNLLPTEEWKVRTTFTPPVGVTGTFTATIEVVDETDAVIQNGIVTATGVTEYREFAFKTIPTFTTVNYKSVPVRQPMTIENMTDVPINVSGIAPDLNNPGTHPGSFSIDPAVVFPFTLAARETRTIDVIFDPSVSPDKTQTINFASQTSACEIKVAPVTATVALGAFTATSYPDQEVFSCGQTIVPITVTGMPSITPAPLTIDIQGPNAANFTLSGVTSGILLDADQTIDVPVVFTPNPGVAVETYSAQVIFSYTNQHGETTVETRPLTAISGGVTATVISDFAQKTAEAGDVVTLPIALTVAKNVTTLDLATANLRKVHLVYSYNTDLLTIENNNLGTAVTNMPAGWTVDVVRSQQTPTGLDLWLSGPGSLTEAISSLGQIRFSVRLPEKDETDEVRLETFELFGANDETFGQCVATAATGTQLNLVYRCGDAIYQQMMRDGKLSTIDPLTPNPITNQKTVTFRYATSVATPITLEIIDPLGNVVDRVVDGQQHEKGAFEVRYDVSNLQNGSYIYRLTSVGGTSSQRFVVTK